MAMKMMGARVEESWAEEIEAIAASQETTTAEICREAIRQFLGKERKEPSLGERLRKIESQLAKLQIWSDECEEWGNELEKRLTAKLGQDWG